MGSIYKNNNPLILLVDIKSSPNETYEVFDRLLNNYKPMLSYVINDSLVQERLLLYYLEKGQKLII